MNFPDRLVPGLHAAGWILVYTVVLALLVLTLLLGKRPGDRALRTLVFVEVYAVVVVSLVTLLDATGLMLLLPAPAARLLVSAGNGALVHALGLLAGALPAWASAAVGLPRPRYLGPTEAVAAALGLLFAGLHFAGTGLPPDSLVRGLLLVPLGLTALALTAAVVLASVRIFRRPGPPAARGAAALGLLLFGAFLAAELGPQFFPGGAAVPHPLFFLSGFFLVLAGTQAAYLLGRRAEGLPEPGEPAPAAFSVRGAGLSPREAEVAELLAEGLSYQDIADRLFISLSTVRTHVTRIYAKTGSRNKVELANKRDRVPGP